jgi:hypothetical protein
MPQNNQVGIVLWSGMRLWPANLAKCFWIHLAVNSYSHCSLIPTKNPENLLSENPFDVENAAIREM